MKKSTILVGGFKFADVNLGTDEDNPNGKYYTWDEAMEACPKGWRLPNHVEWIKFNELTTHEWFETKGGTNGMKFTDKLTGSSIFLPAMGWDNLIVRDVVNYIERCANYWPSTWFDTYRSCSFGFDHSGGIYPRGHEYHSLGLTVRCVQDVESEK